MLLLPCKLVVLIVATVTSCAQAEEDSVYEQFETDCVRQHPRHQLCILMTVGEELS